MTQELIGNEISQGLIRCKEIRQIESAFEQDSKAIAEIGKDKPNAAGNIAYKIQTESGIPNFPIKEAVLVEAKEICDSGYGPDNKDKRANRVKELASVMAFKIMNTFYPLKIELGDSYELNIPLDEDEDEDDDLDQEEEENEVEDDTSQDQGLHGNEHVQRDELSVEDPPGSPSVQSQLSALMSKVEALAEKLKDKKLEDLKTLVGTIDDYSLLCLRDDIETEKEEILDIIHKKAVNEEAKLADNIKKHAPDISREIVSIPGISTAIDTLTNGTNISTGIIQATIEYTLLDKSTDVAKFVKSRNAEEVATLINTPFNDPSTAQQTIGKTMFGVVISGIIKENAKEIAGKKYPSAYTIAGNVESVLIKRGIMQGHKRRYFLFIALADSISHIIVRAVIDSKVLHSIFSVISDAIKIIIQEKAKDIAIDSPGNVDAKSISSALLRVVKKPIADKINQIYYNFNKSIVIDVHQRPTTLTSASTNEYQLKLVKNGQVRSHPELSGSGGNISVSAVGCLTDTNYICVKHTINMGKTSPSDIGGLRLYFGDKEVKTYDTAGLDEKSVFYQQGKNDISVYFQSRHVTLPKSGLLLDKPPLLFGYNGQFYKPQGRDNYFEKWLYVDIITSEDAGDSDQTQKLTTELDSVNKALNRIDLDNIATFGDTTGTVSTNSNNTCCKKYGIPYPGVDKSFYERVCITACATTNYRKQIHATINKSQVGDMYLQGQILTDFEGINPQYNRVDVYYDVNDHHFSRPLLIKLTSQSEAGQEQPSPTGSNKWYKRTDLVGTSWEPDTSDTYDSGGGDSGFNEELGKIASSLYATLGIELNQKKQYQKQVTVKSYHNHQSDINVEQKCPNTALNVTGYQCCEHQLSGYYNHIKIAASSQPNLTFVLEPEIAGIKLGIFTKDDKVAPLLTYGQGDAGSKKNLLVYFWKGDGGADSGDPVPLMFNFNGKHYGPLSKEKYFGHWQELVISSSRTGAYTTELKQKLDHIYDMVNGIDLNQTKTYGLKCCKNHPYYNNKEKEFNCKRVTVTKYTNKRLSHKMYVHTTVHKTKIGDITHSNPFLTFKAHTGAITAKMINQVAVIFKGNNTNQAPLLVLLNQCGQGAGQSDDDIKQSLTHSYYYKTGCQRGDATTEYLFCTFDTGCKIMADLIGPSNGGGNDRSDDQITPANSTCEEPSLNESTTVKFDRVHQDKTLDETDILEVQEAYADPTLPRPDSKDCETDSGGLGDSGCMGDRVDTGEQGSEGTPGQTGPTGPQGLRCDIPTQESQVQEQHVEQHPEDQVQGIEASNLHLPPGLSTDHEIRDRGGNGSVPSDSSFMDVGIKGELSDSEPSTQAQTERTDLSHTSRINLDSQHTIIGGGDSKEHLPLEQHVEQPQQESQVQQNTNSRVIQEQHERSGGVDRGHNGGGPRPGSPEKEVQLPARGDAERGISSSGFSESLTSDTNKTSGDVWQNIVEKFNEQPEVFYGSGAAVAGVGVMGTVGAVVYKKFIIVAAVAASGI